MTRLPIGAKARLPAGALFSLANRGGQWIDVREGAVWITRSGERRDIVLKAGESMVIEDPRKVIIGAINGAAVIWLDEAWDHALAA